MKYILSAFALLVFAMNVQAQTKQPQKTRILFIYDASNSMNGQWQGSSKHQIANKLLAAALDSLEGNPNLELALRVYGHQTSLRNGQDCNDTKLEVPFAAKNSNAIRSKLETIRPKGTTPIAMTLEKCERDFPDNTTRNVVILITDGIEECGGDPCAVSRALQRKGIVLKPFVIGVGLDPKFIATFRCVGNYYDASSPQEFKDVLQVVIAQALNNTTAQVNINDQYREPNESNLTFTLVNQTTEIEDYTFMHTMNAFGHPDTLNIDMTTQYELVVYTVPEVRAKDLSLTPGKHNILAVEGPTGYLDIKRNVRGSSKELPFAIVRKSGQMETVNAQQLGSTQRYLVGKYDLEILTLPRTYINDITIKQRHTTKIEIPEAGLATITTNTNGYGQIFSIGEDGKLQWVVDLNENSRNHQYRLQPGDYKVIFRTKASTSTLFSKEKSFTIEPGASVALNLN